MDFDLNAEQRQLRDEARRFLEREAPLAYARATLDGEPWARDSVWKKIAELGWPALPFAEEHGGIGMGFIALAILGAELGRVVFPAPFLSSMLGGIAVELAGSDEQKRRLLPPVAAGDRIAALAVSVVERDGSLHGEARFVAGGDVAETVVVVAQPSDGEAALFVAEPDARERASTMDATRSVAHLRFDGARAERLEHGGAEVVQRVLDRASVLLAAEMLGAAERVLELSVEYAKARVQFGRPIGSFQAVKHRLADMLTDVESIRNAVYYAAWAQERETDDASLAASMAKAFASDAAARVAKGGIQVHGGIGFTWEHDMHLFFKRVKFDEQAFGDAAAHRERIAHLVRARLG
jgi:alkylation response protein AidB-like acyl-CoA dehydrogenase